MVSTTLFNPAFTFVNPAANALLFGFSTADGNTAFFQLEMNGIRIPNADGHWSYPVDANAEEAWIKVITMGGALNTVGHCWTLIMVNLDRMLESVDPETEIIDIIPYMKYSDSTPTTEEPYYSPHPKPTDNLLFYRAFDQVQMSLLDDISGAGWSTREIMSNEMEPSEWTPKREVVTELLMGEAPEGSGRNNDWAYVQFGTFHFNRTTYELTFTR